jgi:hypothetical protein
MPCMTSLGRNELKLSYEAWSGIICGTRGVKIECSQRVPSCIPLTFRFGLGVELDCVAALARVLRADIACRGIRAQRQFYQCDSPAEVDAIPTCALFSQQRLLRLYLAGINAFGTVTLCLSRVVPTILCVGIKRWYEYRQLRCQIPRGVNIVDTSVAGVKNRAVTIDR